MRHKSTHQFVMTATTSWFKGKNHCLQHIRKTMSLEMIIQNQTYSQRWRKSNSNLSLWMKRSLLLFQMTKTWLDISWQRQKLKSCKHLMIHFFWVAGNAAQAPALCCSSCKLYFLSCSIISAWQQAVSKGPSSRFTLSWCTIEAFRTLFTQISWILKGSLIGL